MAGTYPSHVANEDQRSVDRQAPTCAEKAGRGRRMGTKKNRTTLVGQINVSAKHVAKRKAQKSTDSETRSQKVWSNGSEERELQKKDWKSRRGITPHPLTEGHGGKAI